MSTEVERTPLTEPELQKAIHAMAGIFTVLQWIDDGKLCLVDFDQDEVAQAGSGLIIAGKRIARDVVDRL